MGDVCLVNKERVVNTQRARVCKDSQVKILYGVYGRSPGLTSDLEEWNMVLDHSVSRSSGNVL